MRQTYEKEKAHINLAKLKKQGYEFEVVIDPDLAMEFKHGKAELRDVLKSESIFHDAKKGDLASENLMKEVFGTSDVLKVAEAIITEGEIQLTGEYRDKIREEKKLRIIDMIHKYSLDPRTNIPHPKTRIENAMKEAKVHIDENKSPEDQVQDILKALQPIMPIKFEIKEVEIHLKPEHAAKLYGAIQRFGQIIKDDWLDDGSWLGVVEIPAGMEPDLYDKLNSETHGDVETKVVKTK
ncbi:ribosome assembly factor SBDS [Nanoarchaeota archaeon]